MSSSDENLNKLRNELAQINHELIELYKNRALKVKAVQDLKNTLYLKTWSPEHEFHLFTKLSSKLDLTLKTALLLSLLIEEQSQSDYPCWSEKVHLEAFDGKIIEMINPILLFVQFKSEYEKLNLKDFYQEQIKRLI